MRLIAVTRKLPDYLMSDDVLLPTYAYDPIPTHVMDTKISTLWLINMPRFFTSIDRYLLFQSQGKKHKTCATHY